jgi:glycine hydroxymethyltransferase
MDVTSFDLGGATAEIALGKAGLTVNKNTIPYDTRKPFDPSGIRLGTPAMTSRGLTENDMIFIADIIHGALTHATDEQFLGELKLKVRELATQHPPYPELA